MATSAASEESSATSEPAVRPCRSVGAVLKTVCVLAALVHPVAALLSRYDWFADLFSHFQEPALAASVLAAAVTARRHRRLALALAVLAALQVPPLFRYSGANPVPPDPRAPARLRVLVANVLHDNPRFDDLVRLIRRERPDVVGLVEYNRAWLDGLAAVRSEYPFRVEYPYGAGGIALWFRSQPASIDEPEWLVARGNCVIHASFDFAGRRRHVWVVHPTSPLYRFGTPGNLELTALADRVRDTGGSRVVMGDMNCTEGSAHFHDFLRTTGLRDSRLGFGRQPSWPTFLPYRIAIDHALVSSDLAVVDRRLGPSIGSDHFPLIFDLAPASTNLEAQPSQASSASR